MDSCQIALGALNRLGGWSPDQPSIKITDPTFEPALVKGVVSQVKLDPYPSVYEYGCMSLGCYQLPGIWTEVQMMHSPPIPKGTAYEEGCFEDGAFLPFQPVCKQRVLVPQLSCFTEGAFEGGAFALTWEEEIRYTVPPLGSPCFPPTQEPGRPTSNRWTPELRGTTWGRLYVLESGEQFTLDGSECDDCIDSVTYMARGGEELLLVDGVGPYEPGVYESGVYHPTTFVYYKQPLSECADPCVLDPWTPIGIWECYGQVRRLSMPLLYNDPLSCDWYTSSRMEWQVWNTPITIDNVDLWPVTIEAFDEGAYETIDTPGRICEEGVYQSQTTIWARDRITGEEAPILIRTEGVTKVVGNLPIVFQDLANYLQAFYPPECPTSCILIPELNPYQAIAIANGLLEECAPSDFQEIVLNECGICPVVEVHPYLHRWEYKERRWVSQYYVVGAGTATEVYVVDVGYVHPLCPDQAVIIEESIPVYPDGSFQSSAVIPEGVKYARLRRVTKYDQKVVAHDYGDLPLPRTWETILNWQVNSDQEVDLKDTCVSLLHLILSPYYPVEPCEGVYGWRPPYFLSYVQRVLEHLVSLVNQGGGLRDGSIPKRLTTYSTYESLYIDQPKPCPAVYLEGVYKGNCQDDVYLQDELWMGDNFPVPEGEECTIECFEGAKVADVPDLSVDNEAVAWLLYVCGVYCQLDTDPDGAIRKAMPRIHSYLQRVTHRVTGLVPRGLTQEGRVISEYRIDTAVVTFLASMKTQDVYMEPQYLEQAADLYTAINKYPFDMTQKVYVMDVESLAVTTRSIVYSLLFGWLINRTDVVEAALPFLTQQGRPVRFGAHQLYTRTGQAIKVGRRSVVHDKVEDHVMPFLGDMDSLTDWCLTKLVTNSISRDDYYIGYLPLVKDHQAHLLQKARRGIVYYSMCLTDMEAGFDHKRLRLHNVPELERTLFQRNAVLYHLRHMWPVDFQTWADPKALSMKGVIGRILYTLAIGMATWYGLQSQSDEGVYLEEATVNQLDKWGVELDLPRWYGEDDDHYRERLRYVLSRREDSRAIDLEGLARHLYYVGPKISELPIQSTLDAAHPCSRYRSEPGQYLLGGDAVKGVAFLKVGGCLTEADSRRFSRAKAAGTKLLINDSAYFGECSQVKSGGQLYMGSRGAPQVSIETVCCHNPSPYPCKTAYKFILSEDYREPMYVWGSPTEYNVGPSIPEGERALTVFLPGERVKVVILSTTPPTRGWGL